jgi:dolichol-phosphate mannosyltransferase
VEPSLSIVVPTRDEAPNVAELLGRLGAAVGGPATEILVVDDSDDDTREAVRRAAWRARGSVVRCHHRLPGERVGGLGGAVVAGLRRATAPWVCVMDGDLQHPPGLVPRLTARAAAGDVDLVVASRYVPGGSASGLGTARAVGSRLGGAAARATLPLALGAVTDPLSGFFLVRRDRLDLDALAPRGFKVLVEILARTPGLRVCELPFDLAPRVAGRSKAGPREAVRLVALVLGLRRDSGAAPAPVHGDHADRHHHHHEHERCA